MERERADFIVQMVHLKKFLKDADVHDKKLRVRFLDPSASHSNTYLSVCCLHL